jgi:hypothetical protein
VIANAFKNMLLRIRRCHATELVTVSHSECTYRIRGPLDNNINSEKSETGRAAQGARGTREGPEDEDIS